MTDTCRHLRWRTGGKPIPGRFFVVLVLVVAVASGAHAETWTLEAAHERLLKDGRVDALTDASRARVRAEARAALPRDNPFLGAQREQSFGATTQGGGLTYSGGADSYIWLGQTIDLSFRRGLLDDAGARRANAEGLVGEARKVERLLAFDALFFAVVADSERLRAHDVWLARLDDLSARTEAREAKGDASRYEVLRIERERRKAEQARLKTELAREAGIAELRAWLDDPAAELADNVALAPPRAPDAGAPLRPLLAQAWDERKQALAIEEEAAGRWYLPPVTVSLGGKTAEGYLGASVQGALLPGTLEAGYYATVQVPLPVFERGDDKRQALASARRSAELSAELETQRVTRKLEATRALSATALDALAAHRAAASKRGGALVRTARAAWAGGELSLLALLEAERSVHDDELVAIDLTSTARQADLVHRALQAQSSRQGDRKSDP